MSLPSGVRGGRMWRAGTMRTVVTAILQQTARRRFGSHSLVSDGLLPVTSFPAGLGRPPSDQPDRRGAEEHGEHQQPSALDPLEGPEPAAGLVARDQVEAVRQEVVT